jgi:hypothetical protein
MRQSAKSVLLLSMMLLLEGEAFVVPQSSSRQQATALNLLPSQGSELVAAYAATCNQGKEVHQVASITVKQVETTPESNRARAFVSRVFHLPSAMLWGIHQLLDFNW